MAGPKYHTEWEETKVHTATCDMCNKKNLTTLHRCKKCSASFCEPCGSGIIGVYREHVLPNKTAVSDGIEYKGVVTGVVDTKRPRAAVVSRKKHPRPSRSSSVLPDAPGTGSSPNLGTRSNELDAAEVLSGVPSPSADRISSANARASSVPSTIDETLPSIAGRAQSILGRAQSIAHGLSAIARSDLSLSHPPAVRLLEDTQSSPVKASTPPEKIPSFENLMRHLRDNPCKAVPAYSKMSSNSNSQLPSSGLPGSGSNAAESSASHPSSEGTFGPPPLGTFQVNPYAVPNSDAAPSAHSNASASDLPIIQAQAYNESDYQPGETTEEEDWQNSSPTNHIAQMRAGLRSSRQGAQPTLADNGQSAPALANQIAAQHGVTETQQEITGMNQVWKSPRC